jgi:transposase
MKKTQQKKTAQKEQFWTSFIIEARAYSGGVAAYCHVKNVSKNTYYYWFKRLRGSHPEWVDLVQQPPQRKGVKKQDQASKAEPETEVLERAKRRKFTAKDKARILRETDEAPAGQVAAILRREGLYSSQLQKWRTERDEHALAAKKRGPKTNPLASENKMLKTEVARLAKKLEHANVLLDLQKKIAQILRTTVNESDEQA